MIQTHSKICITQHLYTHKNSGLTQKADIVYFLDKKNIMPRNACKLRINPCCLKVQFCTFELLYVGFFLFPLKQPNRQ